MASRESAYPAEAWRVRETAFDPALLRRSETIFALGNGSLGLRGSFEEGFPEEVPGTYINGFYEETPIVYGEIAFGYARNRQVMLNVADATRIALWVGDERFDLSQGTILRYERTLELALGVLVRTLRWRSPSGREVELCVRRLVSLARPHVAAIEWSLTPLGTGFPLVVESSIEGEVANQSSTDDPRIGARFPHRPLSTVHCEATAPRAFLVQETLNTGLALACAADHSVDSAGLAPGPTILSTAAADRATIRVEATAAPGVTLRLRKYLAYCTTLELGRNELASRAQEIAAQAREAGFAALMVEQKERLDRFWSVSDVRIDGDDALQQGLRFNLFSLLQAAGTEGRTSVAAKGLTGQGYEGHYFWDTEIYVLPFFVYTQPEIARALIRYRCGILGAARVRAAEMSQRGALFPWRTIGGEEASAYYPAGTAQYHIDADIAFALRTYLGATEDRMLLRDGGAELLFETARLWADLGWYNPRKGGAFCIDEVTGPDEYTALVNNNLYTNLMARENLEYAALIAEELRAAEPEEYLRVARAIGLEEGEIEEWRRAARNMYVPYDAVRGIHAQDDGFLDREPWDFAHTPPENHPLMMHYHPLVLYRHQVLKQPDVVLAQVLLGHRFCMAEKKRNYDYYDPLTTGDSSLSPCIQSVAAAEVGYTDKAYAYFCSTARMDLDDVNGNVGDGVHTAAMAGTWISITRGFAGMRDHDGELSFAPRLPGKWSRLRFRLRFRGRLLEITVTHEEAAYLLVEGQPLAVFHRGRELGLTAGVAVSMQLAPVLECVIFDLDGVLTDTAGLLGRLRQRKIKTALASTSRNARAVVERLGISPLLDLIVDPGAIAKGKPDPEILFRTAEALAIAYQNCAAVEDACAGVQAVKAAGMFAVGVGRDLPGADWLVEDTRELSLEQLEERFEHWGRAR